MSKLQYKAQSVKNIFTAFLITLASVIIVQKLSAGVYDFSGEFQFLIFIAGLYYGANVTQKYIIRKSESENSDSDTDF